MNQKQRSDEWKKVNETGDKGIMEKLNGELQDEKQT